MSAKAKSKLTPEQRKATLRRVLEKIRPYGFFVVCSLIVAAVSVAAQLYIPILCGSAIDMMLGKGNVDFNGVLRIVVEIVIVAVVAAFAQWLLSVCNNRITFSVSRDLRNAALRKIQTLPLSYLDSHPSGDIVSRMVADVDTFADGLLMGFTQLFSGVLTILGTLLFMLGENVPITLVVVCITPLSLVVASFLAKRSYKYFQGQSTVLASLRLAQELFGYPGRASALVVRLAPGADAAAVRKAVAEAAGDGFRVRTRDELRASFYRIMTYEKWGIFFIALLVLIIASFSVVGALAMLIVEKRDDISTLRALGADTGLVRAVFRTEGFLICGLGAVAGMTLGVATTLSQQYFGLIEIPAETFLTKSYPVEFRPTDLAVVAASFAAVAALLSNITVRSMIKTDRL